MSRTTTCPRHKITSSVSTQCALTQTMLTGGSQPRPTACIPPLPTRHGVLLRVGVVPVLRECHSRGCSLHLRQRGTLLPRLCAQSVRAVAVVSLGVCRCRGAAAGSLLRFLSVERSVVCGERSSTIVCRWTDGRRCVPETQTECLYVRCSQYR